MLQLTAGTQSTIFDAGIRFCMDPGMSVRLPDWNDLHDVLLIHETGSLSGAARQAGVSQSTMSRRLEAIEAGGRKVFERGPGGLGSLTERGRALVAAARQMRASYKANVIAVEAPLTPLRLAACEVTAEMFMADALPHWARHSDTPVDLVVHEDLFALGAADYDVLVTPRDRLPQGATGIEIGRIAVGLFGAPSYLADHPFSCGAEPLKGHLLIRASGSLARIAHYRWLEEQGGRTAMMSSSPLAQREACARGQGVALLPVGLAEGDPRLQRIEKFTFEDIPVWVLAGDRDAGDPRVASFLRWARRHFVDRRPGRADR